jgi:flagellar motor switch protein FliN
VTLDRLAGDPVDLLVNGTPIARGEVVVVDEQFGLRVTQILEGEASPTSVVELPADDDTSAET